MQFENMNEIQAKLHNAAIVTEAEGDDYGYAKVMRDAIDEIEKLRYQVTTLYKTIEKCRDTAVAITDARTNSVLFVEGISCIKRDTNLVLMDLSIQP